MNKRASTKQKILTILKKDKECTMKELMEYFTISEIAIRRHVQELEQQGFIQAKAVKQEIGRPYYCYKLTGKGHATFPNQYETLPLELLQDLEELHGKNVVEEVLEKRAEREEAMLQEQFQSKTFDEKIEELVAIQGKNGYMFDYEKTIDGHYEITNYNCPIINIASNYKQICKNEKGMLGNLFSSSEVKSHSCITNGDHFCKWIITQPDEKKNFK